MPKTGFLQGVGDKEVQSSGPGHCVIFYWTPHIACPTVGVRPAQYAKHQIPQKYQYFLDTSHSRGKVI
jgi:hypothetical protein